MTKYILTAILLTACSAAPEPSPAPGVGHAEPPPAGETAPGIASDLPQGCQAVRTGPGLPTVILCGGAKLPDQGDPAPMPDRGDPSPERYIGP